MNPHAGFSRTALSQASRYSSLNLVRLSGPDMGHHPLPRLAVVVVAAVVVAIVVVVIPIGIPIVVGTGHCPCTSGHVPAALLQRRRSRSGDRVAAARVRRGPAWGMRAPSEMGS